MITCSDIMAISGEISNIPVRGSSLLMGASTGSVTVKRISTKALRLKGLPRR